MTRKNRKAFTLVELLVVIVIISMLAGLLVPALVGARARARRTQCGNNQHELALAFQQYENAKGNLPGYVNRFPAASTSGQSLSWPVVLLEYLGRNDLWEVWRDPTITVTDKTTPTSSNFVGVKLEMMTCPVDTEAGDGGLSYVVNCGLEDDTSTDPPRDSAAQGVFHDRSSVSTPPSAGDWVTFRTEQIPDGAAQTLLFSENIQASQWFAVAEAEVGMVWVGYPYNSTTKKYETRTPDPPVSPDKWYRINQDREFAGSDVYHARPSSNHPGGVVVTYCDGHQSFLDESIEYLVFARLMAPHDSAAPLPP